MQNNTTNTRAVNQRAMNEIEVVLRTCNTPHALSHGISRIVARYGATEAVAKAYGNGLARVEVLDKDGLLVGEYYRAMSQAEQHRANVAEAMAGDARRLARIDAAERTEPAAKSPAAAGYVIESADSIVGIGKTPLGALRSIASDEGVSWRDVDYYTRLHARPATAALLVQVAEKGGADEWATLPVHCHVPGHRPCRLRCTLEELAAYEAAQPEHVMY